MLTTSPPHTHCACYRRVRWIAVVQRVAAGSPCVPHEGTKCNHHQHDGESAQLSARAGQKEQHGTGSGKRSKSGRLLYRASGIPSDGPAGGGYNIHLDQSLIGAADPSVLWVGATGAGKKRGVAHTAHLAQCLQHAMHRNIELLNTFILSARGARTHRTQRTMHYIDGLGDA